MPDPLAAAIQTLKQQITPQKTASEIGIEYCRLLDLYPADRPRLVQLIRREAVVFDVIDKHRQHVIKANSKLRASYNALTKEAISWPKLDAAFGFYSWTRPGFLKNLRNLLQLGASFDIAHDYIATAKKEDRGASDYEPKHVERAQQQYTSALQPETGLEERIEELFANSNQKQVPSETELEELSGSDRTRVLEASQRQKRRRLGPAQPLPTSTVPANDEDDDEDDEDDVDDNDSLAIELPRSYCPPPQAETGYVESLFGEEIEPSAILDFTRTESLASRDSMTAPRQVNHMHDVIHQLQCVRKQVCNAHKRLQDASAKLETARISLKQTEKEYRHLLYQGNDEASILEEIKNASEKVDVARSAVKVKYNEENDALERHNEAQGCWNQLYELVVWPIEKGPEVPSTSLDAGERE